MGGFAVKLEPNDAVGDLIPLQEWIDSVKSGMFNDDDGMGDYATETHHWSQDGFNWVYPSDVGTSRFNPPEGCTHILWYNK